MARKWAVSDVRRMGMRALDMGATAITPFRTSWDVSGNCEQPRWIGLWGRQETRPKRLRAADMEDFHRVIANDHIHQGTYILEMWTRCRRCPSCRQTRAAAWAYRAKNELAVAPRTWFGTLTLSPDNHFLMYCRASAYLSRGGTDWSQLNEEEQFRARHVECSREITLWLKRVRKESDAPLRFILVAEAHKSGLPHYHVLVHERHPARTVKHRTLSQQWKLGFSNFKLVDGNSSAAWYVCKYLSKANLARVRASVCYGKSDL